MVVPLSPGEMRFGELYLLPRAGGALRIRVIDARSTLKAVIELDADQVREMFEALPAVLPPLTGKVKRRRRPSA